MSRLLFACLACALCQAAGAGTVYKCIEEGRVSYGDRPCRGAGAELPVRAAPQPDPDTAARLARARATVLELDALRATQALREERDDERARRAALGRRARCDKLRLQRQWADEDLARSRGDGKEAARIKARRQAETLALECPA